jgi:hypothetical protein
VHSVNIYTRVSPKLAEWLVARNVAPETWLQFLLREVDSDALKSVADEMKEAATAKDIYRSPVVESESFTFDSMDKVEAHIERRKLLPTLKPKCYATTELIARFISKWFEMIEKESILQDSANGLGQ